MSKKHKMAAKSAEQPVAADVAQVSTESTEPKTVKFAPAYKYTNRQERASGKDYDPKFPHLERKFLPGMAPKSKTSVMGILHTIVNENRGILGRDLVSRVRHYEFPNRKRSQYLDGIPAVGWAEGYVTGALTAGYVKMTAEHKAEAKVEATAEAEASPAAVATEPAAE